MKLLKRFQLIENYNLTYSIMESQRQIRYAELIRSLISDCLLKEDFYDESIKPTSITVSFVRMSKDLKIANVYFMPLGGINKTLILESLKEKKFIFQRYLSKAKIQSKFTPKLNFFLDDTFRYSGLLD